MTWICKSQHVNTGDGTVCATCGAIRPAVLSDDERAVLGAVNIGRRAGEYEMLSPSGWRALDQRARDEAIANYRAARAPLEAENKRLRERVREFEADQSTWREWAKQTLWFAYPSESNGKLDPKMMDHENTRWVIQDIVSRANNKQAFMERKIKELEAQLAQAQKPVAQATREAVEKFVCHRYALRWLRAEHEVANELRSDSTRMVSGPIGELLGWVTVTVEDAVREFRGYEQKPAAPAGLPGIGEPVEIALSNGEWSKREVDKHGEKEGVPAFGTVGDSWMYKLSDEGEYWRRIPPAQASREPLRMLFGFDLSKGKDESAVIEFLRNPDGTLTITREWHGAEAEAEVARRKVAMGSEATRPAASPPGEVSTENLQKEMRIQNGDGPDEQLSQCDRELVDAAQADIRANVERETAKDRAWIAELEEAFERDLAAEMGAKHVLLKERDAARAEAERLKGELARAKEAKRCPADGMSDEGTNEQERKS